MNFFFLKGTLRLNGKVQDKIDLISLFEKLTGNKPTLNLDETTMQMLIFI